MMIRFQAKSGVVAVRPDSVCAMAIVPCVVSKGYDLEVVVDGQPLTSTFDSEAEALAVFNRILAAVECGK